jgi:beta-glucosidase/6-phospho-beta-glucosidase/beta-galactosidase
VDAEHPLAPFLVENGMTDADLAWFRDNAVRPDVSGVNYYPRHSTELLRAGQVHRGGFGDPRPTRDDGVAGLEELLRETARRYGSPVMLTETAVTASVAERAAWLDDSVALLQRLRADGLDVVGYTWWPVFDMYEWTYRHSTAPRGAHLLAMGLWSLVESPDGGDAPPERRPTDLVARFREHARSLRTARTPRPARRTT